MRKGFCLIISLLSLLIFSNTLLYSSQRENTIKKIHKGISKKKFSVYYPKDTARTYRQLNNEEWVTFLADKKSISFITFYFKDKKLCSWEFNNREEFVNEYLGEFCSLGFVNGAPKIYEAIKDVFLRIPQDVLIKITDRARPIIFTEFYNTGTARFANSSEIYALDDDPPTFTKGLGIIKLNTELNDADSIKPISAIVAHEIAHRFLEHAKNNRFDCHAEKEANNLIKSWGFEEEFKEAKQKYGSKVEIECK